MDHSPSKELRRSIQSFLGSGQLRVYLSCQEITDREAALLAQELKKDVTTVELLLAGNRIADGGATALAEALRSNKTLEVLSIGNNQITDAGASRFLEMLTEGNGSLRELSISGNNISSALANSLQVILSSRKIDKRLDRSVSISNFSSPLRSLAHSISSSTLRIARPSTPPTQPASPVSPLLSKSTSSPPLASPTVLSISTAVPLRQCHGSRTLCNRADGSSPALVRKISRKKGLRPVLNKKNRSGRKPAAGADLTMVEGVVDHVTRENASVFEMDALCHMFRAFCEPDQFLDVLKRRFEQQPKARAQLLHILASWVEHRLVPDFFEPFTNRKGVKGDRPTYTYVQLLFLLTRPDIANAPGSDAATRIKLSVLRAMAKRRESSIGPQQQMAVAKFEELPDAREQQYEERLFLVYVALPPPRQVALSISSYDAVLMRQIGCTESSSSAGSVYAVADLVGLNWRNKASPMPTKSIPEVIARSNNLSFWVATRILRSPKFVDRRAETVTLFIQLATALKQIGNLNSVVGVLGGLNHGCVQRLRRTWDAVSPEAKQEFADLETFVDSKSNYKAYRAYLAELAKKKDPAIPYLGVYLRDLVFMEDGMPNLKDGKPNLDKVEVFRKVVAEMRMFAESTIAAYPSSSPFARFEAFAHVRNRAHYAAGTRADLKSDNVEAYFACLHGRSEDELDKLSYDAEPKQSSTSAMPASPPPKSVQGRDLSDYKGGSQIKV